MKGVAIGKILHAALSRHQIDGVGRLRSLGTRQRLKATESFHGGKSYRTQYAKVSFADASRFSTFRGLASAFTSLVEEGFPLIYHWSDEPNDPRGMSFQLSKIQTIMRKE
jgi:hypothetical protein